MKKLFTLLAVLVFTIGVFAQVPERISYQAVIRNPGGELVKSSNVGMKISILKDSESGTAMYVETHTKATNENGLVTLEIGGGTIVSGTFAGIDWSTGVYFLKTETDPAGGTSYSIIGTSQILSVPYALYAKTAEGTLTAASLLSDKNGDTRIVPELNTNDDYLRFYTNGAERLHILPNGNIETLQGNKSLIIGNGAGSGVSSGTYNVFLGDSTGTKNTTSNTTGIQNTAYGTWALASNTTGHFNTANGTLALASNTTGGSNTAYGFDALYSNTTGSNNTANGTKALYSNTTGYQNTANGYRSLFSNTTGNYNTANGYQALYSNTTGNYNTANGWGSLSSNTIGNYNTANGLQALNSNTTGSSNTANGVGSLSSNTEGSANTANGLEALFSNTTGYNNTVNGYQALFSNTTGNSNTANGHWALYYNTTGHSNVAMGTNALANSTIISNTVAIGDSALFNNISGSLNYYGTGNTAVGSKSLYSNTIGYSNTANGYRALSSNTEGSANTANGQEALNSNTIGSVNTANGYQALYSNTTGFQNTANGYQALYLTTTGSHNTANGYQALYYNTTGYGNTAIGSLALIKNQTGVCNVAIGFKAGYYETGSNKLYIDNSATSSPLIWGDFTDGSEKLAFNGNVGIGTLTPIFPLDVAISANSDQSYGYLNYLGHTGTASGTVPYSIRAVSRILAAEFNANSDARIKDVTGLSDMQSDLEIIKRLQVKEFQFIDKPVNGDKIKKGFIAQEVEQVFPEAVSLSRRFIPDIYRNSQNLVFDKNSKALTIVMDSLVQLKEGDKIQLYSETESFEKQVIEVLSDKEFRIGDWEKDINQLFVYGKEVDDFRAVDYDRIFTLGISAIQELCRQNEEQQQQIESYKSQLQSLKEKVDKIEAMLAKALD